VSTELPNTKQELIAMLGRIVGDKPLPDDLQRTALEIFVSLLREPTGTATDGSDTMAALSAANVAAPAIGSRRLVYVHGICRHAAHFSDPWWDSLHPFVPAAFGQGTLAQTRLEVVWSDLVNEAAASLAAATAAAETVGGPPSAEIERRRAAEEIKEALRDRADQHVMAASIRADGVAAAPVAAVPAASLISIPGLNCIDDFSVYLIDDSMRQAILNRFIQVVRPELQAGRELDIISHSWGTVVAYEGLRQIEDEGLAPSGVRNFFTVGAALSIGPVKMRLRPANRDGKKPASVRRWINLDAHGDLVGGPLKGRPYAVDTDFLNLDAVGCSGFLGVVNPQCAHSSYFDSNNIAVNRDIFANFIDKP
jgi:metacaspase-1